MSSQLVLNMLANVRGGTVAEWDSAKDIVFPKYVPLFVEDGINSYFKLADGVNKFSDLLSLPITVIRFDEPTQGINYEMGVGSIWCKMVDEGIGNVYLQVGVGVWVDIFNIDNIEIFKQSVQSFLDRVGYIKWADIEEGVGGVVEVVLMPKENR